MSGQKKGLMLITILMLTALIVMLTTSMIFMSSETLVLTGNRINMSKVFHAAEAGVEYAFYQLNLDSTWTPTLFNPESLGNEYTFEFISANNNLLSSTNNGTTPAYCYELLCKGSYKEYTGTMRALFAREDFFPHPVISEGQIILNPETEMFIGDQFNPGRVHSNNHFFGYSTEVVPGYYANVDLKGGFISSVGTANTSPHYNPAMKFKDINDQVVPVRVPDINVSEMVDNRPAGCKVISGHTFYIVGYFEYDPNAPVPYCIPHIASKRWYTPYDTVVYDPLFKMGIIRVHNETCYENLMRNLRHFYSYPLKPDRNLYNYYSYGDIDFWEFDAVKNPEFPHFPDLDAEVTITPDPNCENIITFTSKENLYISPDSTMGIVVYGGIHHRILMDTVVKWDLAGHNIYGDIDEKLWIGIPVEGSGCIISKETIDFYNCHEANLVVLSEKSVRMTETGRRDSYEINKFNGILYGKDNVSIENEIYYATLSFNGAIVSRDNIPDNLELTPMLYFQYGYYLPDDASLYMGTNTGNVTYTTDGIEKLVPLRGNNFKVRKHLCEIVK